MSIPIKCFSCGTVLADKYAYYLEQVIDRKQKKAAADRESNSINDPQNTTETVFQMRNITYLSAMNNQKTIEGLVMDEMQLVKMCCRRHLLTHVDNAY